MLDLDWRGQITFVLGSIWYHSEPLNVPLSPNRFLVLDFIAVSYRGVPYLRDLVYTIDPDKYPLTLFLLTMGRINSYTVIT
jgi:hypothetical protein